MRTTALTVLICTLLTFVSFPAKSSQRRNLEANKLTSSLITSSAQDSLGYIWIGTEYGLNKYDGIGLTGYYKDQDDEKSLLDNSISTIYCDRTGRVWIGMTSGMQMYDHKSDSFKTVTFEGQDKRLNVTNITQLVSGQILAIIYREGIFEVNPDTMNAKPMQQLSMSCGTSFFTHIYEDRNHRLWIGTENMGVFCIWQKDNSRIRYSLGETYSMPIDHIAESTNGSIIVACDGGIWVFDDKEETFSKMEQPDGTAIYVRDMALLKNGDLIAAAEHQGLWRIEDNQKKIEKVEYERANIVNLLEDREKNLWCGCLHKGFMTIMDTTDILSLNERELILTNIYIDNRSAGIDNLTDRKERIRLKSENQALRMTFSTMTMRNAEIICLRYRMSGFDKEWKKTEPGENSIEYDHLPAGRYTMEVCAEGHDDATAMWQQKIIVKRPWYCSIIAYILYTWILCGAVVLIVKGIHRRQQEEANERKFYYYANMAHEIRSPMVMIMNPIERLIKTESDPETLHILKIVKRNSRRVLRLMNHFLDNRKLDEGDMTLNIRETDMVELIRNTLETFAYEAGKRGIKIEFEYPYDKLIFNVDPDHIDTIVYQTQSPTRLTMERSRSFLP